MEDEDTNENDEIKSNVAEFFGHSAFNTIWKMPSVLLNDFLASDMDGQNEWPDEITMFQPNQVGQILLYENANCLAIQTYFKMVGVDLRIEQRVNTEFMLPGGKVPIVKYGSFLLSDLDRIAVKLKEKGKVSGEEMKENEKADMRAYMALVNNVLFNAELYICWLHDITYQTVTAVRYASVYPWPLGQILTWKKKRQIVERLSVLQWRNKSLNEVYENVDHCLSTLSGLLGDQTWFLGARPTELDALVFGHVFTILTTTLPDNKLTDIVNNYPNLVNFCRKVESEFFEKTSK